VGEGSPGARNYTLYFQNSSNSSCTLRGYPRVVHAGSSGTWVGREASASAEYMNSAGVTLNPGDSTTAVLRSVYPARFGDDCGSRPVQGFLVGLPSGSGGVIVPLDTTACSSSVPQLSVGQFGAR
jgi:antimicrobial peptide ABC transporter, permease protein